MRNELDKEKIAQCRQRRNHAQALERIKGQCQHSLKQRSRLKEGKNIRRNVGN